MTFWPLGRAWMNKKFIWGGIAAMVVLGIFTIPSYFQDGEFKGFKDKLAPGLREKINEFRFLWGAPVVLSSVGRHQGDDSNSQHNIDKWGETRALDFFPQGIETQADAWRAIALLEQIGFTGIGIYPDKNNGVMLHADVRPGDRIARWSFIGGVQYSLEEGVSRLPA